MSEVAFNSSLSDEVNVSPDAVEQLLKLVEDEDDIVGVRIFVSGGGCSGMTYGMTFVEEPGDLDCIKEEGDLKVYVDAVALGYLKGVEIDYSQTGANRSFVFKNVFASSGGSGSCGGCGGASGGASGGGCG